MKKLKYLLIAILFAAFAGEGVGQDSYIQLNIIDGGTTSNSTISNPTSLSCNPSSQLKLEVVLYYGPNNWQNHVDANDNLLYHRYRVIIKRKVPGGSWSTYKCTYNALPSITLFTGGTATSTIDIDRVTAEYKVEYLQIALSFFNESKCTSGYVNGGTMGAYDTDPGEIDGAATSQPTTSLSSTLNGISPSATYEIYCDGSALTLDNISVCSSDQYAIYVDKLDQATSVITSLNTGALNGMPNSTIDLLSFSPFVGFFEEDYKYRITIKSGLLGVWPTSAEKTFHIDLRGNYSPFITVLGPDDHICIGESETLEINNPPPSGYTWVNAGQTTPQITVSPIATTTYNITFTDQHCTTAPSGQKITVHLLPVIDLSSTINEYCVNNAPFTALWPLDGSPDPNIPGAYAYWISNDWNITHSGSDYFIDASNVTQAQTGVVTYKYKSDWGCWNEQDITIEVYNEASYTTTVTDVSCNGLDDGSIMTWITGNAPYTSILTNSINSNTLLPPFTGLEPATYYIEITDVHGCVTPITTHLITEPSVLTAQLSKTSPYLVACKGDNMSINFLPPSGGVSPYQYNFGSGYSSYPYASLPAGAYNFSVKDDNGCTFTFNNFDVNEPYSALSTFSDPIPATCWGISNGEIEFTNLGGTPPINYNVSNGVGNLASPPNIAYNLAGGNYSVTVTDHNGCNQYISGINVGNGSSNFTLNAVIDNDLCLGIGDGKITLTPSNTAYTYSYNWASGTNVLNNLIEGTYSVVVTGSNNCKVSGSYAVANDQTSRWHKNTENTTGQDDDIKRVLTDANGDVYTLGEFTGTTMLDGEIISSGTNGTIGFFLAKYDNCGNLRWYVHSDMGSLPDDLSAVDIAFDNQDIVLFGNNPSSSTFNMKSGDGTHVTLSFASTHIFSVSINTVIGTLQPTPSTFVPTMIFNNLSSNLEVKTAKISGTDTYLAGQFGGMAGVNKNNSATNFIEETVGSGNIITDIEITGNMVYAIANISNNSNFGSTPVSGNGGQDGVILQYDMSGAGSYTSVVSAHGDDVTLKDLAIDNNDDVWVVGQFNGEIQGWSSLMATQTTALIMKFDNTLSVLGSYYLNPQTSIMTKSSANAIGSFIDGATGSVDAIYVAGTFIGSDITLDGTGNMVQAYGGSGMNSDLWLAEFSIPTSSGTGNINWINSSSSQDPVTVNAMAYDNMNTYVVGSYQSDIILPPSSVLTNPSPGSGTNLGYVIRGGDVFGSPAYYKSGSNNTDSDNDIFNHSIQSETIQLGLYPNPNNGTFTLQYVAETSGTVQITIYDVTGRLLFSKQANKESYEFEHQIVLSQYNKGMYLLHFEIDGITSYQKFVIE